MRRPVLLLAVSAAALVLTSCTPGADDQPDAAATSSSGGSSTAASSSSAAAADTSESTAPSSAAATDSAGTPSTAASTAPAAAPAGCADAGAVEVSDAKGLQQALDNATPGQTIRLVDGTYQGNFVASTQASADQPIHLCGSRGAVLDGGDIDGDYTLHLSGATYWSVTGLTVTGGQKGVMVDAGVGNRLEGLLVTSMGDEAIHLRKNSTDNVVTGNTIRDTGKRKPKYGEGIYVGSAKSNWCQISDCDPDRSDRNVIEGNTISGTTAESVDIKEGTTGGTLRGNTFQGNAMTEADSWVDVKGNDWTIEGNTGTDTPTDGFQVHEVVDGWGRGNVFIGNTATVPGSGLAIDVAGPKAIRAVTEVRCDNVVDGGKGISNVECKSS